MKTLGPDAPKALASWTVLLVEEASVLALPALIGFTIDGLLAGRREGLALLAGGVAVLLAVGALRRFVDTRVFTAVELRLAERIAAAPGAAGLRAARLRQINDLVQVYERSVPEGVSAVVAAVGSLAVSALYDWRVAAGAVAATLVLLGLNGLLAGRVARLNGRLNDAVERDVALLEADEAPALREHLRALRTLRVARSDAEVGAFALNWLVLLALIVAALVLVAQPGASPGAVFAQMSYLLAFAESWNRWPTLVERWTQARDVARRLAAGG